MSNETPSQQLLEYLQRGSAREAFEAEQGVSCGEAIARLEQEFVPTSSAKKRIAKAAMAAETRRNDAFMAMAKRIAGK